MDYNFWSVLGTWLGAIATAAAVIYALYRDLLFQPKLIVSFDHKRDIKDQANTVGVSDNRGSRWLRVRVVNKSQTATAKNCRAYLIGARDLGFAPRMMPDGVELLPNDVRQLQWMHDRPGEWQGRDLLPGVNHWVDILSYVAGYLCPTLCTYPEMPLGRPGDFIFDIQISAESAKPVTISLRVRWGDDYQTVTGEVVASGDASGKRRWTSRAAEAIASPAWRDHRVGANRKDGGG
jgi:hypothetical protein